MKTPLYLLPFILFLFLTASFSGPVDNSTATLLEDGRQPQLTVDTKGITRVVYGLKDNIYCATSANNGKTFSEPVLVGQVTGLYLGMAMGPQIASSANYSLVTAIDKKGNIHTFRLKHGAANWTETAGVNDVAGSAPEGMMSVAADDQDNFYAVRLDVRYNKQNKIAFASTTGKSDSWAKNKIVYESPDKTVCECCKPSITVKGKQITLMFRNWLNGNRDFYFVNSTDKGQNFTTAQKLGTGSWKLEGCPMDGGGVLIDNKNQLHTTWQREGNIFYAQPGKPEIQIGKGRNCRISGKSDMVIAWQEKPALKVKFLKSGKEVTVGNGSYIETTPLPDKKLLCVWESDNKIYFRKI